MSIVGSHLDISEARNGVRELIKMYPDLKKEYQEYGIVIKEKDSSLFSMGGIEIDSLPEVFEDCDGEYGFGSIVIENIVEYDENILGSLISSECNYDTNDECESYYIGLTDKIGFKLDNFVPKYHSSNSSKIKRLPKNIQSFIDSMIINHRLNTVSRLHMVKDIPVISYGENSNLETDFGLTDIILNWVRNVPIKDVYIILGEKDIENYITKKNNDGEYTITIF